MKMNNYLKAALLLLVGVLVVSCNQARPKKNFDTFAEMADPTNDTLSDWSAVKEGLNASFLSIDVKHAKSVKPEIEKYIKENITGWKGETLSAQILLWSAENINQLEFEFSDFKSGTTSLSSDIAQARFVRYVMTDEFAGGCGHRKPEDFAASLAPDMLDNLDNFNMEAKTVRPVWITVEIPANAVAGDYKSEIKLYAEGQKTQNFELNLTVQDKLLPTANNWDYHLDFWQHPSSVARVQNLEMWSDAHFEALVPQMKMLADAGQKVITATLNKEPWNNQCFDPYADMIHWTKNEDASWTYDYKIFDRWVQLMMDLGVNKMINCYSVVPWNNEVHYKDGKTGEMINVKADPGTKVFNELWPPFLLDFKKHLTEKGWLEITNIAMDERTPKEMEATIEMLQRVVPEIGVSYQDNQKSYKRYPFIKDMSVGAGAKVDHVDIVDRRERGLTSTYYVCCSDKFPNMFTFSGSAEAVYSAWYAVAADFDGLLRWAYNSWVESPFTDSRFRTWPAGDTYIVYPEARSSIRFERLLEGIQDVEKIKIIKAELNADGSDAAKAKLAKLDAQLVEFNTTKPTRDYVQMVNDGKKMINELSK